MEELWQLIENGGVAGVLVFVGWLILTGKLRPEREYLDMRDQRDEWKDEALASRLLLRDATDVAERAVHAEVR